MSDHSKAVNNDSAVAKKKWLYQRISLGLLSVATVLIFAIAELIRNALNSYDIQSLYISFVAGFILFTPLVSLVLHPFAQRVDLSHSTSYVSTLMANIGLVVFVQFLFFLIWMTDAVALYSIYVDQTSFLAQAFNIQGENKGEFSEQFFVFNLVLAWLFSILSIVIGLVPCLIARIKNTGVIGNFVASFSFTKRNKGVIFGSALLLALAVLLPLLYAKYAFLMTFPVTLLWVFKNIARKYTQYSN